MRTSEDEKLQCGVNTIYNKSFKEVSKLLNNLFFLFKATDEWKTKRLYLNGILIVSVALNDLVKSCEYSRMGKESMLNIALLHNQLQTPN